MEITLWRTRVGNCERTPPKVTVRTRTKDSETPDSIRPRIWLTTTTVPAGTSTTTAGETTTTPQTTVTTAESTTTPTTTTVFSATTTVPVGTSSTTAGETTTTTSTTTTSSTTTMAKIPEVLTDLVFRSSDTFIEALRNSSTAEYQNRSKLVKNQLEGIYKPKYVNYLRVIVIGFSQGSIITTTQIVFSFDQSVPSIQDISDTLLTAVRAGVVSQLNIIPGSVSVNGSVSTTTIAPTATTASSGLKIESSLLQATCLIILSQLIRLFL